MIRDPDGNTMASKAGGLNPHKLSAYNYQAMGANRPNCEQNGFELLILPLADNAFELRYRTSVVPQRYAQC